MGLIYVIMGLALLVAGGEALVRGASGLALAARVAPAVIGLTIVAAGTSTPELVVSVQSAVLGNPGIAVGNVVGSNLFNIGAILGIAAIIRPLRVVGTTVRREWPVMAAATALLVAFAFDGHVGRLEATALITGLVAFTMAAVVHGRREASAPETASTEDLVTASFGAVGHRATVRNLGAVLVGVGALAMGSTWLVRGASGIASGLGVSDTVIGLTIVAAGTSTPELVTSIVAALRGRDDIAIANVLGSNIFNVFGILGVTAAIHPLDVPAGLVARDLWWLLGALLLLLPLMRTGARVSRGEGGVLLVVYAVWLGVMVRASLGG